MKTKIAGIYLIECENRTYVGQSVDLLRRWQAHKYNLKTSRHSNKYIKRLYDKYGEFALSFKIIQILDSGFFEKLDKKQKKHLLTILEQTWMNILGTNLNMCPAAGSRLGTKQSEETKKKIGLSCLGNNHTEETIDKMSHTFKLWDKDGNRIEGRNITKFAREQGLSHGTLVNLMKGNLFHYKGYTTSIETHLLYKMSYENRGISFQKKGKVWRVQRTIEGKNRSKYFKNRDDALAFRAKLEAEGYRYITQVHNWKEKAAKIKEGLEKD